MRVLIDKAGLASTLLCDHLHELAEKELTVWVCVCVCVRTYIRVCTHACLELSPTLL